MKANFLQKRMLWTVLLLMVYLFGQFLLIPFVRPKAAMGYLKGNPLISVLGMYTGAQTSRPSLFMLGIGPYMTANIVLQAVNSLDLKSLRQVSSYFWGVVTNFCSLLVAILQAFFYTYNFRGALLPVYFKGANISFMLTLLLLVSGGMASVFIANLVSEYGVGGSSVLMVPQLIISLPALLIRGWGNNKFEFTWLNIIFLVLAVIVTLTAGLALVQAEERIPMSDPQLDNVYAKLYFPLKLLMAGAMPFMFSTSLFIFLPLLLVKSSFGWKKQLLPLLAINQPIGILLYIITIISLNFVFGLIMLQPSVRARELKENGSYFYNIIPGTATEKFIMNKFVRLTWLSSFFLILLSVWPLLLGLWHPDLANLTPFIGNLFILLTIVYMIVQQFRTLHSEQRYVINLK
ncbi:hypothetical protein PT285_09700 [Lactobacillus sp. ESL0791]|uniref:hypothetical protein n=1 Tax=Lactobacillus sp. ESL0791 TaxID=2983234 RepID=UPI0023F9AFC5|nr:hypothetical protein [Lactobacillus sp. ESL0791]MDF7639673.1 hypothetical protein [Lactobacillus sp. ESL0791]